MNFGQTHARHANPRLRFPSAVLGVAAFALLAGCLNSGRPATTPANSDASTSSEAQVRVPLPQRTPFDDDAKLRDVYLEYYANGYTLAVTDTEYSSPGCLCEAGGDARRYDAMADGFFAGRAAGTEAFRATQKPAVSPASL